MSDRTKNARRSQGPDDSPAELHRMLPASQEAEEGLLCSALLQPQDILEGLGSLPAELFFAPARQLIWEQLTTMHGERVPIDTVTLTQRLYDRHLLETVGGPAYLSYLFTFLPTHQNAGNYVRILREKYVLRGLIKIGGSAIERAYTEQDDVANLMEDITTQVVELASGHADRETMIPIYDFAVKAIAEIEYAYKNRGGTVGLPTGFADLDRMTGGLQKGFTYYFGARPAMGKSSLALAFATEVSTAVLSDGAPVAIFSVEMTGTQLAKRMIFTLAEINQQRARDGFLSQERDWDKLMAAAQKIATARLVVDETAALTIADFRSRSRRWIKQQRRKNGVRADGKPDGVIIIDYLQRMKGSSKRAEDARYLELQEIAQGISQVAKDLQVPILVFAQLKRPKDKKPDTEPDMTEFRECGDIEQEAHVVALIHRPHYYVKHSDEKQEALAADYEERFKNQAKWAGKNPDKISFTKEDLARYAKIIIDKQREGPVGVVDLRFIADYTKFETWDTDRALYSNNAEKRQVIPDQAEAAAAAPVEEQTEFLGGEPEP